MKNKKILMLISVIFITTSFAFSAQTLEDYLVEKGYLDNSKEGIERVNWFQVDPLTIEDIKEKFPNRLDEIRKVMLEGIESEQNKIIKNAEKSYSLYRWLKQDSETKLKLGYNEIKINEEMAIISLKQICAAYQAFYAHNHSYPQSLFDLVNTTPSYIDKEFDDSHENPKSFGYEFEFTSVAENEFSVSAKPILKGKTGNRYFVINQGGVVTED